MHVNLKIAALASTLSLMATTALAYPVERIQFARNAVSATVTGSLQNYQSKRVYLLRMNAWQKLDIRQVPSAGHPVTISVTDPRGRNIDDWAADCHSYHESMTRLAGDYRITVTACKRADPWKGKFIINVTAL